MLVNVTLNILTLTTNLTITLTLPYLSLPYGEGVLQPSAEASNGPNAQP